MRVPSGPPWLLKLPTQPPERVMASLMGMPDSVYRPVAMRTSSPKDACPTAWPTVRQGVAGWVQLLFTLLPRRET